LRASESRCRIGISIIASERSHPTGRDHLSSRRFAVLWIPKCGRGDVVGNGGAYSGRGAPDHVRSYWRLMPFVCPNTAQIFKQLIPLSHSLFTLLPRTTCTFGENLKLRCRYPISCPFILYKHLPHPCCRINDSESSKIDSLSILLSHLFQAFLKSQKYSHLKLSEFFFAILTTSCIVVRFHTAVSIYQSSSSFEIDCPSEMRLRKFRYDQQATSRHQLWGVDDDGQYLLGISRRGLDWEGLSDHFR